MRFLFTILLLFGGSISLLFPAKGQSSENTDIKLPRIVPPSPDAASLGKYADIPVGYYTGLPNISIPIHTIQVRDITVPISLSYHASGIRVEEEASWVGLGWSLMAGGVITRSINGIDDLKHGRVYGYAYSPEFKNPKSLTADEAYYMCVGQNDAQPDIFYYNFLGHSGKFFLQKKDPETKKIEVSVVSSEEKITIHFNEADKTWTVFTKEGMKYIFGTKEYTTSFGGELINDWNTPDSEINISSWDSTYQRSISSWYLDKIISPKGEEIDFIYDVDPTTGKSRYVSKSVVNKTDSRIIPIGAARVVNRDTNNDGKEDTYVLDSCHYNWASKTKKEKKKCTSSGEKITNLCDFYVSTSYKFLSLKGDDEITPPCSVSHTYFGSVSITEHVYLKQIRFKTGGINFVSSSREDIQSIYNDPASLPRKLSVIELYDSTSSTPTKSFVFNYSYYNSISPDSTSYINKRLKLIGLREENKRLKKSPYVFHYEGDGYGVFDVLPAKNSDGKDHWGFMNGKNSSFINMPATLTPSVTYMACKGKIHESQGADRECDENYVSKGVLNKIEYPTGGYTEFTYESNDFMNAQPELDTEEHFYGADSDSPLTFHVDTRTKIEIVTSLKCNLLSCYGVDNGTGCTEEDYRGFLNDHYLELRNENGGLVDNENFNDYAAKLFPDLPQWSGYDDVTMPFYVISNYCGIQRKRTLTIDSGTYTLKTFNKGDFTASATVKYKTGKIVYPGQLRKKGGGLRISMIKDSDGIDENNDIIRKFNYSYTDKNGKEISNGRLMTFPLYFFQNTVLWPFNGYENAYACANLNGYSYSTKPLGSSAQGNFVGYDTVKVSYGKNGENGTSVFAFKNDPDEDMNSNANAGGIFFPNIPMLTHSASNGKTIYEAHYRGNDNFKLKETKTTYTYDEETDRQLNGVCYYVPHGCHSTFAIYYYYQPSEWWHLDSVTEKIYDISDPSNQKYFSTTKTYSFNYFNKLPTEINSLASNNSKQTTSFFYPDNFSETTLPGEIPREMWDDSNPNFKHIYSPVIRQVVSDENKGQISGVQHNYFYDKSLDQVLPKSIEKARQSDAYSFETRLLYEDFDSKGNVTQISLTDGAPVSYIWGYNQTLPIAEVKNASSNQIFYTSFEEDGIFDNNAKTGNKVQSTPYTYTPSADFNPATNSLVIYWYWDNGWYYHEEPYHGGTITIAPNTGTKIDEFRIHPADAQMTTYCYDPTIGVITATDMRGQPTYYNYDDLSRLKMVKDLDGNVMKFYDYQYKKESANK